MKVENTTEHDITINAKGADGVVLSVTVPASRGTNAAKVNGSAEVDDKILSEVRGKDPVIKAWFDSGDLKAAGAGKRVDVRDEPDADAKAKAEADAAKLKAPQHR